MYDVIIAGGSISGLVCARELAAAGHSVLVAEKANKTGSPDHCGGLVAESALSEIGAPFLSHTHRIDAVHVHSPSGKILEASLPERHIIEISRCELDCNIAEQARHGGAIIRTGTTFHGVNDGRAIIGKDHTECKVIVDARGIGAIPWERRRGIITSAQYEVRAEWICDGRIEVFLDAKKYPGFFAWIIPAGGGRGKVGVAGRAINPARAISSFLEEMGGCSILRRSYAPVWVGGPAEHFVTGNMVKIGDAAGQTKPTSAGGIFSCGMGGIMAASAITNYLKSQRYGDLNAYESAWSSRFGKEFGRQARARGLLERLGNTQIELLFKSVSHRAFEAAAGGDFDFHASSIAGLLGAQFRASLAGLDARMRSVLSR